MMNKSLFACAVSGSMLLAAAALISGCGVEAKQANAPRVGPGSVKFDLNGNPIDTVAQEFVPGLGHMRYFIEFKDVKLFMWRSPLVNGDVGLVLDLAKKLEEAQDVSFILSPKIKALAAQLDPVVAAASEDKLTEVKKFAEQLSDFLPENQRKLAKAQSELAEAKAKLEDLRGKPVSDEIAQQISDQEKKVAKAEQQVSKLNAKIEPILKVKTELETNHAIEFAQWQSFDTEFQVNQKAATDYLDQINAVAWIFNSTPQFKFEFTKRETGFFLADGTEIYSADLNGPIRATLHDLDLADIKDPLLVETGLSGDDFTSEPHPGAKVWVEKVSYKTLGGVFTFELHTPAAQYWFRLTRANYHALDKRIHYKGEIMRCGVISDPHRPEQQAVGVSLGRPVVRYIPEFDIVQCGVDGAGLPEERRGAANLVDQKDN